jgi:4-carboxymuconolactone decarboxylase
MGQTIEARRQRGLAKLVELDRRGGEVASVDMMGDLGRYIVEFGLGEIYQREGLSVRDRELAAVAMLIALGGRETQVRFPLGAALNVGMTVKQLEELIIHTVPFAGFPGALNAFAILKEVAAEPPGSGDGSAG